MTLFIFWIAFSIIAAVIADKKGRSTVGFFFLALLLSPIIGILAAFVAERNEDNLAARAIESGVSKKCPYCAEIVRPQAIFCRFCGKDIPQAASSSAIGPARTDFISPTARNILVGTGLALVVYLAFTTFGSRERSASVNIAGTAKSKQRKERTYLTGNLRWWRAEIDYDSQPVGLCGPKHSFDAHVTISADGPGRPAVRIMNIQPRYSDCMKLSPGKYDVLVEAPGYQSERAWITLVPGNNQVWVHMIRKEDS